MLHKKNTKVLYISSQRLVALLVLISGKYVHMQQTGILQLFIRITYLLLSAKNLVYEINPYNQDIFQAVHPLATAQSFFQ